MKNPTPGDWGWDCGGPKPSGNRIKPQPRRSLRQYRGQSGN